MRLDPAQAPTVRREGDRYVVTLGVVGDGEEPGWLDAYNAAAESQGLTARAEGMLGVQAMITILLASREDPSGPLGRAVEIIEEANAASHRQTEEGRAMTEAVETWWRQNAP
jgi:hypothetical protein